MTYGGKTGGRKCGTPSKQTLHQRLQMAQWMEALTRMNALQRQRYVSDYFFRLAEGERAKGDRADITFVADMMERAALLAAKTAPYVRPKLAAISFDSYPRRTSLDLAKLTDDELEFLERITEKAEMKSEAIASPRTPDEYLASTAPSPPQATHDGHEEVEPPDARSTDDFDHQA